MSAELALKSSGAPARRWKPYPAYKDSGVKWLGKAPEGWEVRKLKRIAKINLSNVDKKTNEGEEPVKLCNYLDVYYNDYITPDLDFMDATASANQIDKFALRKGDVIITKDSESWEDIAVPAYVPADLKGVVCGYHLALIRPNYSGINGEYLFWSLYAPCLNYQFRVEAHGITRFGLEKYCIDNSQFLVPPINEQEFIASFLDRQTAHLDALISKKERLIALLEEKRAALISSAVTKGLDPKTPMRDSGVEWLGEIPAHWVMKRLKDVVRINPEALDENTNPDYILKYVDIGNVSLEGLLDEPDEMRLEIAPSRARRIVRADDVIVSTVRTYLKAIARFPNPEPNLIVSTGFAVLRPTSLIYSSYLYYTVRSNQFIDAIMAHSEGVGYPAINSSVLASLPFWFPLSSEQRAIASFLDRETAKIDALIVRIRDGIEKLREYRTALISAAVTGKIDVREEN